MGSLKARSGGHHEEIRVCSTRRGGRGRRPAWRTRSRCQAAGRRSVAGDQLQYRLVAPKLLINLKGIEDLARITPKDGGLSIGSMTTYANVAASEQVRASAPALAESAGSVGSLHIRNLGTVGGSLCHADPAGDVPVALLALDAMISIDGPRGRAASPLRTGSSAFSRLRSSPTSW